VRRALSFFAALWLAAGLPAAEISTLLQDALAAEARLDCATALRLFHEADAARPNDAYILQKIARQYSDLVDDQAGVEDKRRHARLALDYSRRAAELNPSDPVNVLSVAVSHGKLALYSDTRTKVRYSRLVREEAERALALNPDYAWAHHVLGRWHCEVAELGTTSRLVVRLFYGGLPAASPEEGLRQLRRATELEPGELTHWLELGFACAAAGRTDEARRHWEHGLAMPSRHKPDEPAKRRARAALARLDQH
jgi:tetratricopeptide (TPR) repeat protein